VKLGEAFANEEHNRKQGAYCTMGSLLESLNEEDRQTLNDVMGRQCVRQLVFWMLLVQFVLLPACERVTPSRACAAKAWLAAL
jgi:hypothetical protein